MRRAIPTSIYNDVDQIYWGWRMGRIAPGCDRRRQARHEEPSKQASLLRFIGPGFLGQLNVGEDEEMILFIERRVKFHPHHEEPAELLLPSHHPCDRFKQHAGPFILEVEGQGDVRFGADGAQAADADPRVTDIDGDPFGPVALGLHRCFDVNVISLQLTFAHDIPF